MLGKNNGLQKKFTGSKPRAFYIHIPFASSKGHCQPQLLRLDYLALCKNYIDIFRPLSKDGIY